MKINSQKKNYEAKNKIKKKVKENEIIKKKR